MLTSNKLNELNIRRRQNLLSQNEAAKRLGISQGQYFRIERGYAKISPEMAEKLTEMLSLPDGFFDEAEDEKEA